MGPVLHVAGIVKIVPVAGNAGADAPPPRLTNADDPAAAANIDAGNIAFGWTIRSEPAPPVMAGQGVVPLVGPGGVTEKVSTALVTRLLRFCEPDRSYEKYALNMAWRKRAHIATLELKSSRKSWKPTRPFPAVLAGAVEGRPFQNDEASGIGFRNPTTAPPRPRSQFGMPAA